VVLERDRPVVEVGRGVVGGVLAIGDGDVAERLAGLG